jgi:hypothetical protein
MRRTPAVALLLLSGAVAAAQGANTLLLDAGHLSTVRTRVRTADAPLKAALAVLEEDAAKALAMAPVSVMDKAITPPGGDKHDYMSQAPYWWPDPAKANGLPYIQRDGQRNPEINRITDHANFDRLMDAVATLGLAYHLTGRDAYAEHAARLLRTWFLDLPTRMNPHLRFGQGIPGITEGRGIGLIETRMLPGMLDGVILIRDSTAWSKADDDGLRAWMGAYLKWMLESEHGKAEAKNGNNHETFYDVQVAGLALYTGQPDLARRTLQGSRSRVDRQIEPDGSMPREIKRTRSLHYSLFNLEAFFRLATLGDRVGVDLWSYRSADGRSLRQALDFLVPYLAGEQKWPYDQITAVGPQESTWLLRRAAIAWKEPNYHTLAMKIAGGPGRLDLITP